MRDHADADVRELTTQVLALALGRGERAEHVRDWAALYALAFHERCAALGWLRSGPAIRQYAPPAVVTEWRRHALSVAARGEESLALLAELERRFGAAGVEAVSVKGPVMSIDLYGEPVRPIDDLDLFIAARYRPAVREMLFTDGWTRTEAAPGEDWEVFERTVNGSLQRLDLFSTFPKHLASGRNFSPDSVVRTVGGHRVRVHEGASLAPYLATHLAKHEFPPLLWFIDFASVWSRIAAAERDAARDRARQMFLHRYLQWAVERADVVDQIADGNPRALDLLGITPTGRIQPRRWRRELLLAGSLGAFLRLLLRAAIPRSARSIRGFPRMVARRIRGWRGAATQVRPFGGATRSPEGLPRQDETRDPGNPT